LAVQLPYPEQLRYALHTKSTAGVAELFDDELPEDTFVGRMVHRVQFGNDSEGSVHWLQTADPLNAG
jgi:hypothetical protein